MSPISQRISPINKMMNRPKFKHYPRNIPLLAVICALILTSCGSWLPDAHRIDVTQGNAIKREDLDKIQTGMKKSEITAILGSPLISDPFHAQRWDYIYRYMPGRGEPVQSRVTLFFENDVLIKIDSSGYREPEPDVSDNGPEDIIEDMGPQPEVKEIEHPN